MPQVPGAADNVTASGQSMALHGSGRALSFLLLAGWGPANGPATLVYADGKAQKFNLTAPDWYGSCHSWKSPGVVFFNSWHNQPDGRSKFTSCAYATSVKLDYRVALRRLILPDLSPPAPADGKPSMHIFAITLH
jgi:hypothetical protein